jgi:teichuronic acid exporter
MKHPAPANLGQSIRKSTQWLVSGGIGSRVLEFAFGVVLSRLLAPADFGMLITIQIFSGLAGFFSSAGLGQALIQARSAEEIHFRVAFTLQLLTGGAIYTFFFLTAPMFAVWYNEPLFTELMRVSALTFLIRPFIGISTARLSRHMQFKAQTLVALGSGVLGGVSAVWLAFVGLGVWSLVLSGLASALFTALALCLAARWRPAVAFDGTVARSLAGFGAQTTIADLLVYVRNQLGNFLLSRMASPLAVGLFNKADSLAAIPMLTISGSVYQPTFRALATVQDNPDKSRYIYFRAITLVLVYTLPFYVGLWWLAGPFIEVVYGPQWLDSARSLEILALGGLCRCVSNQSGAVIAAQRRLGKEIVILLETVLLLGVGTVLGVRWGIEGVALASLLGTAYQMVRMAALANRAVRGSFADLGRALLPALQLNAILGLALLAGDWAGLKALRPDEPALYLLGMGTLGGLAYFLSFLFLPIAELETEAGRWKAKLGLARPRTSEATAARRPAPAWRRATAGATLLAALLLLVHRLWYPLDELWLRGVALLRQALE